MKDEPTQMELFPCRDKLEDVIVELVEGLPITEPNQLIAALRLYGNTLVKVMNERAEQPPTETDQ